MQDLPLCARFGVLLDGRTVEAITLTNGSGISATILTLGATVQSLVAPDRHGVCADVALGYANAEAYVVNREYFGVTLGRFANRVAGGRFELDGRCHQLATNDGPNALHGGIGGFGRKLWTVSELRPGGTGIGNPGVTLSRVSPDGEDGYPGTLAVTAAFDLDAGALTVNYRATADRPTIVNLSNHTYFNLSGAGGAESIMRHLVTIPAEQYLPIDATSIPTGEFRAVAGTPFDFRTATPIGARVRDGREPQIRLARGYDHSWVLGAAPADALRLVARVHDPDSGRTLDVSSNQPGLQFYTGNHLDGTSIGKSGQAYRQSDGFSLEPQRFPDTPNRPEFGSARLAPGELYDSRIVYRLWAT